MPPRKKNITRRPPLVEISEVRFPKPQRSVLANGVPLYDIRLGTQDILRIEVVYQAGRWYERLPLAARATAWMLREGTTNHLATQISETLDFYGATLRVEDGFDTTGLNLYCLTKHLPNLLPLFQEMLTQPAFPRNELDDYVRRSKQRMLVELEKVDVVAYRELTEMLFGSAHPYGYNSTPEMFDQLGPGALKEHFDCYYRAGNCSIFVAGKSNDQMLGLIGEAFGTGISASAPLPSPNFAQSTSLPIEKHVDKADSSQTAIRLGRRLFTKHHPDYQGVYVINTILGGYFGARLMSNLREEKGYTYGVYSSLETMNHDGYLYVSTEVDKSFREDAVREIRHEMRRLCEEPVGPEELAMVRNYLLGNALRAFDGPFNVSEAVRDLVTAGLGPEFYEEFVDTVKHITSAQLQDLAQRYLNPDEYVLVTVG